MSKHRYEFHLIDSNPLHIDSPRIFLLKVLDSKIEWAFELDSVNDVILRSEFDKEEAEYLGYYQKIDNGIIKIRNSIGETEDLHISAKLTSEIQILIHDTHALAFSGNSVFVMKHVDRSKYRSQFFDDSEKEFMLAQSEKIQGSAIKKKVSYETMYEQDEYVEPKKKKGKK